MVNKERFVIKNLKDLKEALKDVPDSLLEEFWFGCGEQVEDSINIVANGETYVVLFDRLEKDYPKAYEIVKLIDNITTAQRITDTDRSDGKDYDGESLNETLNTDEGITSDFDFKPFEEKKLKQEAKDGK